MERISNRCKHRNDHQGDERGPYGSVCEGVIRENDPGGPGVEVPCECWCHEPRPGHGHKWSTFYSVQDDFDESPNRLEQSCICGAARTRLRTKKPVYKTTLFRKGRNR